MRCVSKCFLGRSFKVYFLMFGVLIGFSLSTFIQVADLTKFQTSKAHLGKKEVVLQESRPVRGSNLENHGQIEEYGEVLELSDYDYHREPDGGEGKQRVEADHHEVIAGANRQLHHRKPSPPSSPPSLAVPNPPNTRRREYESKSWQGRNVRGTGGGDSPPRQLSDELVPRQTLLVGVITSVSKLMTQTLAIQGTWGPRATQVVYFVGEVVHIPHLPPKMDIVQLEGVDDQQGGWELKEISAIKYFMDNYLDIVDWFMLIGDETYVAAQQLEKKLNGLDARYPVYMGRAGAGEVEGEEQKGGSLCQRDPGVVYSRALIEGLRQYLPTCWPGGQEEGSSLHGCLRSMDIKCTQAREMNDLFLTDMKSVIESPIMFSQPELAKAIALHPVHYPKYMYRLHTLFMEIEYNSSVARTKDTASIMQSAQPFIPSHLRSAFHLHVANDDTSATSPPTTHSPPIKSSPKSEGGVVLRPRHMPKNKFEINYWEYFNQTRLMSIMSESPARGIIGGFREEARFALTKAIYLANQGVPQSQRYIFDKLENGYHHVDPMRGSEFILDFVFHRQSDRKSKTKKRLSILRPFHETVLPIEAPELLPTINFLVTLSGLSSRLEHFLAQYERNVLQQGEDATLTIVLFESPDAPKVRLMVQQYMTRYQGAHMNVVDLEGEFARGVGLHHGMKMFSGDQLIFIVDVDLDVSTDFLQRCRLNSKRGKQVYFPVFFKLYNQDFVNRYHRGNHSLLIARHKGHWAHYSFGMVCLHAGDYHRMKGFDVSMRGWGEEDVDLLDQVLKSGLEVFRAPDPGLVHNWHTKTCNKEKITNAAAYEHCLQSKGENLADRIELARYVFDHELAKGNSL